jgi:arabinose-5-phosphate isomerase
MNRDLRHPEVGASPGQLFPFLPADVLLLEADALRRAAERLDDDAFARAVDLIERCTGKTFTTGAGTSGIIARKIAATLTSTGTPASFLHPSDALHGGLGAVTEGDVLIAVSNSGEADEVLALLPYARHRGVELIALTGNVRSNLAVASDVVIDAGAEQEACPLNLAPTSSTTVALAIGDALAISLLDRKGLTPEEFARNHPSGRLGRRLTLRVRDLMQDAVAVAPGTLWADILMSITAGGLGAVVVVDGERLRGIITDGDVRRALQRVDLHAVASTSAADLMTSEPVCVSPDVLAYDAMQLMEDRPSQISVVPVVDPESRCVGMVRLHDLVRAGL